MKRLLNTTAASLTHTETSTVLVVGYTDVAENMVSKLADSEMFSWFASGLVQFNNGIVDYTKSAEGWDAFTLPAQLLDPCDTVIAQLTHEGRNLLARAKLGDVTFRIAGWQLGRGGYDSRNPVKIKPFIDSSTEAVGWIDISMANTFVPGDKFYLNGVPFSYGVVWTTGLTVAQTIENIRDAIIDSKDLRQYRIVEPVIDPVNVNRIIIRSLVPGDIGNYFPIWAETPQTVSPFAVMPMNGGSSTALEDPAFPVPPTLGIFNLPEGRIEEVPIPHSAFSLNSTAIDTLFDTFTYVNRLQQNTEVQVYPRTGSELPDELLDPALPSTDTHLPGGPGRVYFIVNPTATTFQLSKEPSGVPIDFVTTGSGTFDFKIVSATAYSFAMRIPDGPIGMNAYGELGLWVELLQSTVPGEVFTPLSFLPSDIDVADDKINFVGHNFVPNVPVRLTSTGTMPLGLSAGVTYYIVNPTYSSFQISSLPDWMPIDLLSQGTGTISVEGGSGGSIGRKVLFAHGHFPVQAKTDRSLLTFRTIVTY